MFKKQNQKTLMMLDAGKLFRTGTITEMDTDTLELSGRFYKRPCLKKKSVNQLIDQ